MINRHRSLGVSWVIAVLCGAAFASADIGYRGWGIRGGIGDDPDQGIVGFHWDLGTLAPKFRLMPAFELGFGDDHTIAGLVIPVHYTFAGDAGMVPYIGGGALLSYIDRDRPRGRDDSEFDIAPTIALGVEWPLKSRGSLFLELNVSGGDAHDAKLLVGWTRRE